MACARLRLARAQRGASKGFARALWQSGGLAARQTAGQGAKTATGTSKAATRATSQSTPESKSTDDPPSQPATAAAAAAAEPPSSDPSPDPAAQSTDPLETVLLMQPPQEPTPPEDQQPSMSPPPYVHHFDSFSLVQQLRRGGFAPPQATTAMKAMRTLLAKNLDMARQRLVSKSDVENETYLFTAACSELSTEMRNTRRRRDEQNRQQRTHLQHEVDNLTLSLNQELLTLNDNVRGLFNDRRMAVREEQKAAESAIQKINYKMSIMLSSDSRSEIEGLRWILIRRSVLGIIFMAILTLAVLRYASYVSQQRKPSDEPERRLAPSDSQAHAGPDPPAA